MLKKVLAWKYGVVIAFILLATYGTARKDKETRDQYEQKCSQLNTVTVSTTSHGEDCDIGADRAARNLPLRYHLFAWPEGITVWAILLTLFAIAEQTSQTRRSADAAAEAANAAYGNLSFMEAQFELMKEKERARLDVNVERNDLDVEMSGEYLLHLIGTLSIRNVGESKAFVRRISGILTAKLRNEPLGDLGYATLDLPERVFEPNKPAIATKAYCFPEESALTFAECMEKGTYSLHFFGFIEYETMGLWWRKEFGYDWTILDRDSGLGGLYGLSDPYPNSPRPAKDRITFGYWRPNEERDKPEYPISDQSEATGLNPN